MQYSPAELKDKLLEALDKDNNVVDMCKVLEVLSILEKYPITKEALEQTRIGKLVNELRRKTSNKDLARRAKNLVRKWQQYVSSGGVTAPASTPQRGINGGRITPVFGGVAGGGGGGGSTLPSHVTSSCRPASPASRPSTPANNKSNVFPPTSLPTLSYISATSRPGTPSSGLQSRLSPRLAQAVRTALPGSKPASPAAFVADSKARLSPDLGPKNNISRPGTPTESLSKVNVANKRKRRGDEDPSPTSDVAVPAKRPVNNDPLSHRQHGSLADVALSNSDGLCNGLVSGGLHHTLSADNLSVYAEERALAHHNSVNAVGTSCNTSVMKGDQGATTPQSGLALRRNASCLTVQTDSSADVIRAETPGSGLDTPRSDRTPSVARSPKVKTTAQLIQRLHTNYGLTLRSSETVTKIALNQIEKEPDYLPESVVPAGAKPRPRRKPGTVPPSSSDKALSETKNEMVRKFLQSSIPASPSPSEVDLLNLIKMDQKHAESPEADSGAASVSENNGVRLLCGAQSRSASPADALLRLRGNKHSGGRGHSGQTNGHSAPAARDVDPWSLLPPLDLDSINWDEDEATEAPPPEPPEVTDEVLDRLETDQWEGVNGRTDADGAWRSWTNTYSMPSFDAEPLHILPYVNIDD